MIKTVADPIVAALKICLDAIMPKHIFIAYSGGLDSSVLLNACDHLKVSYSFIHIQHGLHQDAASWASFAVKQAQQYAVECIVKKLDTKPPQGESIEAWARTERYKLLAAFLSKGDVVLTAHHQDDQAETVLLRLCRGAGPKGLSAMQMCRPLGQGQLVRPFLSLSRAMLEAYGKQHQLKWIDDSSNSDERFDRNFIRHQLLPLMESRFNNIKPRLSQTATIARAYDKVYQAHLVKLLSSLMKHRDPLQLDLALWSTFNSDDQKSVLRYWLEQQTGQILSYRAMGHLLKTVIGSTTGPLVYHVNPHWQVRSYQQTLYLTTSQKISLPHQPLYFDKKAQIQYADGHSISILDLVKQGLDLSQLDKRFLAIQFYQSGMRVQLPRRKCHHRLKNLLQCAKVPPWLRMQVPLVCYHEQLVMIFGYACYQ